MSKNDFSAGDLQGITRDELWELERSGRSRKQNTHDIIISVLPAAGFAAAVMEYLLIPNKYNNQHPERYLIFLAIPIFVYAIRWILSFRLYMRGNRKRFAATRHSAPFLTAIYLVLALFDWATLKTGLLLYPFIPWVNDIINSMILDAKQLAICTLYSLRLLMTGYLCGSFLGLITGVACGYSKRVYYWINPIVRVLGPIPTATWIPLIMLLVKSLTAGSAFIVGLGAWFAVTVATTTRKQEPAYGQTLHYWIGASCTSATNLAEHLGYFAEEGLTVEGFKGESDIEAVGTDQVQIAIGHIAKATVPATNGVNIQFVGAAHLLKGCKAIYVLADSPYQCYEDLKGQAISVPNGIGASDYNITARLLIECGLNPLEDVTLTPVEIDACVAAMQNGEIAAALLGESFGYPLVEQGVLRKIDSKSGDSQNELCCIIMMNKDFVAKNPITSEKLASCVKRALKYMGEYPEETTKTLMELGLNPADKYDMNLELNKAMEFGMQSDEYATEQMKSIVKDYIEVGLITATDDADAVIESLWHPLGSAE